MSAVVESKFRWPGDSLREEVARLERARSAAEGRVRANRRLLLSAEEELETIEADLERAKRGLEGSPRS